MARAYGSDTDSDTPSLIDHLEIQDILAARSTLVEEEFPFNGSCLCFQDVDKSHDLTASSFDDSHSATSDVADRYRTVSGWGKYEPSRVEADTLGECGCHIGDPVGTDTGRAAVDNEPNGGQRSLSINNMDFQRTGSGGAQYDPSSVGN